MKTSLFLAALFLVSQVLTSKNKKKFPKNPYKKISMDNKAVSDSNSVAVKTGLFGNANAFSSSNTGNFNLIGQDQ